MIKKEEENRYNALKKKFQNLENQLKKKEEELEPPKNLTKLKQIKFLENLENLTKEYAEIFKDMQTTLLEKEDTIYKLMTEKSDRNNKYLHSKGDKIGTENPDVENKTREEKDSPANGKGITIKNWDNRKCFNCIKGPIGKDCPFKNKSKWCNFCSKDNHQTEDSWSARRNSEKKIDKKKMRKISMDRKQIIQMTLYVQCARRKAILLKTSDTDIIKRGKGKKIVMTSQIKEMQHRTRHKEIYEM